jgi:3-oxoacyl-[acyl-carrier-protein] synthase III
VDGVITFERVEAFAPEKCVTVEEVAAGTGLRRHQARMFRRLRGLDRLRWDPDLPLFDLVCAPAERLLAGMPDRRAIRYLIFAHTVRDLTPSQLPAAGVLRDRLGLPHAEAFAVTQQHCASGLAAVDVAGELLRAGGDPAARALVLTGEKPFTRIVRVIHNASLMGEAATACLVGLDGTGPRVRSYAVLTEGEFAEGYRLAGEPLREFGRGYTDALVAVMRQAVAEAGASLADIRLVVPHNVNMSSWLRVCADLGLPRSRVFLDNIAEYSHCSCADPFLNLVSLRERGLLAGGGLYLLTAVGLGATYAAMVLDFREPAWTATTSAR